MIFQSIVNGETGLKVIVQLHVELANKITQGLSYLKRLMEEPAQEGIPMLHLVSLLNARVCV